MAKTTNKEITEIGRYLMKLCKQLNMTQNELANELGVSVAFMSRVKYGEKMAPDSWYGKLTSMYIFSNSQREELFRVICMQPGTKYIDLTQFDYFDRCRILNYVYEIRKDKEMK